VVVKYQAMKCIMLLGRQLPTCGTTGDHHHHSLHAEQLSRSRVGHVDVYRSREITIVSNWMGDGGIGLRRLVQRKVKYNTVNQKAMLSSHVQH
jgi:hypothetical protein